ncbi:UvrD-helicase domain-containing protein [Candidatus Minimicrobia naudis]|uniref:UvrD-helicase domain-containing protein n=1 Tax=Candidatus Minimicrobia naudis TaxID=2841263 RepID=A0A8F1MDL7_9BACT|nr:UvrD-helicase domain-containing protein [Candidatus Minimicrobia naudis]
MIINDKQSTTFTDRFLVIVGPGTGKTELLSMRTAQILGQTDTLPNSILCLTFTESGATNMRQRLRQIIGEDAYKLRFIHFTASAQKSSINIASIFSVAPMLSQLTT